MKTPDFTKTPEFKSLTKMDKFNAYVESHPVQIAIISLFIALAVGCAITTALAYKGKMFNLTDLNSFKHVDVCVKFFWGATAGTFLLSLIFLRPNTRALHKEYKKILAKRQKKAQIDHIIKQHDAELSTTKLHSNEALNKRIKELEEHIERLTEQTK